MNYEDGISYSEAIGILSKDSFFRDRVSSPTNVFDCQFQYNKFDALWNEKVDVGGNVVHLPNESALLYEVTNAQGSTAIRQSKEFLRYQPGKSQLILMTGNFMGIEQGISKKLGYFCDSDGVYFEVNSDGIHVGLRSSVSGGVVDTLIHQSKWNVDTLESTSGNSDREGKGISGWDIDLSKAQIFFFDLEWLGVGQVRFGIFRNGKPVLVHAWTNTNVNLSTYMKTANLPVRVELVNVDGNVDGGHLRQICCSVISEGGQEDSKGCLRSMDNGTTPITLLDGVPTAVIAVRPKIAIDGVTNRSTLVPQDIEVMNLDGIIIHLEVFIVDYHEYDPGVTWDEVPDCTGEYTVDNVWTELSGVNKRRPYSAYINSDRHSSSKSNYLNRSKRSLTVNMDGTLSETMVVVATAIGGNTECLASMVFLNLR